MDDLLENEYTELTIEHLEEVAECKEKRTKQKPTAADEAKKLTDGVAATALQTDELQPDKTLTDGEVLPQYFGKCPDHLMGKPLADLDPYYKMTGIQTFCVATERFSSVYIYRFNAENSCFLLSPFNPLRRLAVRVVVNQFFDYFIMLTILVNCVFLALDNEVVESEYVFTAIYTLEIIIKMVARGVIFHKFSYMRDAWNWLDFIVVITAYITIIMTATQSSNNFNLSALRTFRVIRALKSFTIVPGLKTIVNALLQSIKPLAEVMVIMMFLLVVVSLIGLQAYQGVLKRKCVLYNSLLYNYTDEKFNEYMRNPDNWNPVEGELVVCGNSSSSGRCPDGYVCMQDVGDNPNYGYTNFDNFGWSMLTSFQLITLDFWENVYNMIIRAEGAWNVLFFFMCIILGPFYLLNLLLAVVALAYSREEAAQKKNREIREEAKTVSRRRIKRRRMLQEAQQKRLEKDNCCQGDGNITQDVEDNATNGPTSLNHGESVEFLQKSPSATENKQDEVITRTPQGSSVSIKINDKESQQSLHESRRMERPFKKDMSQDSSESANSSTAAWKTSLKKKYSSFHKLCCSWSCPSCFNTFQTALQKVVHHNVFKGFIIFSIISNTLFLAMDHHEIDPTFESVLTIGNYVFTGIFAVEATLKILALGLLGYFRDHWNKFDFIIVVVSLLEFGLPSGTGAISVLRALRLMRVFRLAKIWTTMRKLMAIILKSLSAVVYLTVVLFMVLFIFAVVGKQLLGPAYAGSASKFDGSVPRWNFGDFYHSFLLAWRVMCGEWIEPLHECMHITNSVIGCVAMFLPMIFIGTFLCLSYRAISDRLVPALGHLNPIENKDLGVLNLFTAILLEAFEFSNLKTIKEKVKAKANSGIENVVNKIMKKDQTRTEDQENGNNSGNNQNDRVVEDASGSSSKINELTPSSSLPAQRSVSMSNVLALNRAIVNKRNLHPSSSLDVPSDETHSDEASVKRGKRKILIKQERISEEDEPSDVSSTDKEDCQRPKVTHQFTSSSKKVKFNISSNSKVHPQRDASQDDSQEENQANEILRPPRCFPKCCSCCSARGCMCFGAWSKCRTVAYRIVKHRFFEWFILLIILASTISLTLEDVNLKYNPELENILNILEYVFTGIFTIEMLMKWIGLGFHKYFTNWWCIIDFVIVAISWVGIGASASGQIDSLKALRTLRALRPLRAVSRWEGMRVVVNALVNCIPAIGNVLCVCLLLWLVFSIIGVQLFKGQFYRCQNSSGETIDHSIVHNRTECLLDGNNTWTTPRINFNNVLIGMIALFQVATFEGWMEVMSDASDAVGVYQQPQRGANDTSYIFFFIFVLIGSFFILNLIVGAIIESFQHLKQEKESKSTIEALLTDSQKSFYKTMQTMLNRKPKKTIPPPTNPFQLKIFNIVTHSKFEVAVFGVIVLNMLTLAMEHYKMSETWTLVLRYVDLSFTIVFIMEATLKIIGMRFYYFRDGFNVFDFVVVTLSVVGFILEEILTFLVSPTLLRVVRVFRVFRVLRVIRAARGIRRLILTLMISLPALFNIAVLLCLFMVIFAILGMSFFMDVKLRGALNDLVNFQTFANSFMLLFRLMTSAGWNDVLEPLMDETDCEANECGEYYIAIIYFLAYIFLVFLVIVNMYIAIILKNFEEMFEQEESGLTHDDFEFFYLVWARFDPKATQFVSTSDLSDLLHNLHPPFQLAKPNEVKIAALDLPIVRGDKVHCLDVLFALVRRIIGEVEFPEKLREDADARMKKSFPDRHGLRAETTTLSLRKRAKAAKVIQDAWRGFSHKRRRVAAGEVIKELHFHTGDIAAQIFQKKSVENEKKIITSSANTESIELIEIDETQSPLSRSKQRLMLDRQQNGSFESQQTVSTNPDATKNTSFESPISPKETSALVIENKHTDQVKDNVVSTAAPKDNDRYSQSTEIRENSRVLPISKDVINDGKNIKDVSKEQKTIVAKKSPVTRVPRTLPTPVVGKELKINPRIGQLKKTNEGKKQDENSNNTATVDIPSTVNQSVVIINKNSTG